MGGGGIRVSGGMVYNGSGFESQRTGSGRVPGFGSFYFVRLQIWRKW
jgi:hypothetical protein